MSKAYPLYAFHILTSNLNNIQPTYSLEDFKAHCTKPPNDINSDNIQITSSYPLFITYTVNPHHELRGCIGTFAPLKLEKGIKEYALVAALEDTRFHPIKKSELPNLSAEVTILKDFEPIDNPLDWRLGEHGLRISFVHNGRSYGGTFLPSVAPEQGWDKEETLQHLIRKAGFRGSLGWRELGVKVTRYQGDKVGVRYDEYLEVISELK